jgi:hypothetical protein
MAPWRVTRQVGSPKPLCSVAECKNLSDGLHGLCKAHQGRVVRGIQVDLPIQPRRPAAGLQCSVQSCESEAVAKGLCALHSCRSRQGRPLEAPRRLRRRPGQRLARADGYVDLVVPANTSGAKQDGRLNRLPLMLEHRFVMQQHLGRPLLATETVHHRDSDKTNNSLDNLELWGGRHGKGGRLQDNLMAAIDLLMANLGPDLQEMAVLEALRDRVATQPRLPGKFALVRCGGGSRASKVAKTHASDSCGDGMHIADAETDEDESMSARP